eukprot:CFRG4306T1
MQTATHEHRGAVVQSPTGTGKSLSFLLPVLSRIVREDNFTQAMIITPYRELSIQLSKIVLPLIGGGSKKYKENPIRMSRLTGEVDKDMIDFLKLNGTSHLVITTPHTAVQLFDGNHIRLDKLNDIVLDEADKLFDKECALHSNTLIRMIQHSNRMKVKKHTPTEAVPYPRTCKTTFVTATVDKNVLDKAILLLGNKGEIVTQLGTSRLDLVKAERAADFKYENSLPKSVRHYAVVFDNRPARRGHVTTAAKALTLRKVLAAYKPKGSVIAFLNNHAEVPEMRDILLNHGFGVSTLATNVKIKERAKGINQLVHSRSTKGTHILVSTEMAARGLDLPGVELVVNLDVPLTNISYIHRSGRVGRIGMVKDEESTQHTVSAGTVVSTINVEDIKTIQGYARSANLELSVVTVKEGQIIDVVT